MKITENLRVPENNWKSMCACRLTENEHKKTQKVQKEKDEIGENRERIGSKITDKKSPRKSASLEWEGRMDGALPGVKL